MKSLKILTNTLVVTLVITLLITGCAVKREDLKFKVKEGSLTLSVKKSAGYKLSTNSKDFKNTREQGILIGKDFKIGIEFNDDFDYFFKGDFDALKKARKGNNNYKEITYSGIKGIQYYYPGYKRYEVILPIKNNKKYFLDLTIYGKEDTDKSAKEAIQNEEVLDVLNNIKDIKVK